MFDSGANAQGPRTPSQAVLRADEMSLIQSVSDGGLLAHGIAASVMAFMLQRDGQLGPGLIWLGCMFCALGLRYILYLAYKRATDELRANRHWGVIVAGSNFLIGAVWGWLGFSFFTGTHGAADVALILALTVAAGSAQIVSPSRESLAAVLGPMLLPFAAKLLLLDEPSAGLNRDEREDLEQVVLHHVPERAGFLVETAGRLDLLHLLARRERHDPGGQRAGVEIRDRVGHRDETARIEVARDDTVGVDQQLARRMVRLTE